MAARVEVEQGPDAGWRFTVLVGEVRVGRGAGHQIKLTDAAMGAGHLRVQFRGGGYVVTNHMPHPVFLDGQLLAVGEQRNWYAGGGLQPTAGTLLRLQVVEVSAADTGTAVDGVVVEPPGRRTAKKTKSWEYAALAVVVIGVAAVGYRHLTKPEPPTAAAQFTLHVAPALSEAASRPGPNARYAEAARRAVQVAVFKQSEGDLTEAKLWYLEARELIAAARRAVPPGSDPVVAAALDRAGEFVSLQLQVL